MKQHILNFLHWIALSFKDTGDVSSRRLTAFAITNVYIFSRIYFCTVVTDPYWLFFGFVIDALFVLLLFGIVTFKEISELKNGTVIRETSKIELTKTTTEQTAPSQ